jgi:hypothetical protein
MVEWIYRATFSWPWHYLEVSGQLHVPAALPPGKEHWIGGWVGPRAGLDDVRREKSWPYRDSNPDSSDVKPLASRYTDYAIKYYLNTILNPNNDKLTSQLNTKEQHTHPNEPWFSYMHTSS